MVSAGQMPMVHSLCRPNTYGSQFVQAKHLWFTVCTGQTPMVHSLCRPNTYGFRLHCARWYLKCRIKLQNSLWYLCMGILNVLQNQIQKKIHDSFFLSTCGAEEGVMWGAWIALLVLVTAICWYQGTWHSVAWTEQKNTPLLVQCFTTSVAVVVVSYHLRVCQSTLILYFNTR
jgi:hypothetical protein